MRPLDCPTIQRGLSQKYSTTYKRRGVGILQQIERDFIYNTTNSGFDGSSGVSSPSGAAQVTLWPCCVACVSNYYLHNTLREGIIL